MARILCYSVRLESLTSISERAYSARSFNGSECVLPKSMVFGMDYSVQKSDAYWIAAWILEQKDIQYSEKKQAWFDRETRRMLPTYTIERHVPVKIEATDVQPINELQR